MTGLHFHQWEMKSDAENEALVKDFHGKRLYVNSREKLRRDRPEQLIRRVRRGALTLIDSASLRIERLSTPYR